MQFIIIIFGLLVIWHYYNNTITTKVFRTLGLILNIIEKAETIAQINDVFSELENLKKHLHNDECKKYFNLVKTLAEAKKRKLIDQNTRTIL